VFRSPSPQPPESGTSNLARSAGATGVATLASRVLGLARDQVLAAIFGAGNEMDAFIVAFRIPNLLRDLFAEGAMSAAFVPSFTRHLAERGEAAAWRLANNVLNALLLVVVPLVAAGMVFAPAIVSGYAGDYASVPGKLELTIRLTRLMLPFLPTIVAATVAMGVLNSLHYYFVPALSPAMFNVSAILCAVFLVPVMPLLGLPPIMAIAIGALLGGIAQVAIQWPLLRRHGYRYRPFFAPGDKTLGEIVALMGPGTVGLAATQVNVFVTTLLATGSGTGAVSWLTYAFRLMYLPLGLFGVSIATAVLPAVSRHAVDDDMGAVRTTVSRGLALMLMVNVPATFGLLVLADSIVRLLFEHGRFTPSDTAATAAALRFYALGLVGYSAARIISPVFYALRQSRTAVWVSGTAIGANAALSLLLTPALGFRGLALATALAAWVNAVLLALMLRRRLYQLDGRRLVAAAWRIAIAAMIMSAAVWSVERVAAALLPGADVVAQAVRLTVAIGAGVVVLGVAARALAIREFGEAIGLVAGGTIPARGKAL
jgi:putative peptidoglycan lipid II flippase